MGFKRKYLANEDPVINTYDYLDLATGTGYKRYYPAISVLSGSTIYSLIEDQVDMPTSKRYTKVTSGGTGTAFTLTIDQDYDLLFKNVVFLLGKAIANITIRLQADGGEAGGIYLIINYYHVSSSGTETLIGTATSEAKTVGASTDLSYRLLLTCELTQKKISLGEKLRVNIQGYTSTQGASMADAYIYHDCTELITVGHADEDAVVPTSQLTLDIPFKVDI